jgi:hypothetical protein
MRRPVRGRQHFRIESGNWMAPWAAGKAEQQTVDDVQPGNIVGRMEHFEGSKVRVAAGAGGISAGVGRSQARRMTWWNIQSETGRCPAKSWPKLQHWQEQPAGTTFGRTGRVVAAYKPKGHHNR